MSDFVDASALLTENKMNSLGLDIARLSGTTSSLLSENKTMTIMICILVLIIVVLLVIMYRVYTYTSSIEDLIYGRRYGSRSRGILRGSSRRYRDADSDWDDADSDWEDDSRGRW